MGLADAKRADKPQQCAGCGKPYRPFKNSPKPNGGGFCSRDCFGAFDAKRRAEKNRVGFLEPPPVDGARWVSLGKGRFTLVDADLFERVNEHTWWHGRRSAYNQRGKKRMSLHHFVTGIPEHVIIDHRNRDPLDNRRENLRIATLSQNGMNSRKRHHGGPPTSKYKGVWWDKEKSKWAAMIRANKKAYALGRFTVEEEAARAYDRAAKRLHGEFALLNFLE